MHLVAGVGEQFEHADEHAVVAQQVLLGNHPAQRQDLVAVVPAHIPGRAVGGVGFAQVRPGRAHRGLQLVGRGQGLGVHGVALQIAPVEHGQADADFIALPVVPGSGRIVEHGVMADAQFDIRQAGEPVQPLFFCRGLVGGSGQLQVEPRRTGRRADLLRAPRAVGQVRQPLGQLQFFLLALREAEHPDQLFPGRHRILLGCGQAGGRIRVKGLLAGVLQPAEVAHLLQAAGQFGADLAHLVHLLRIHQPLPGGHRPHPSPADG